jgi:hypothetical protein
MEKYLNCELEGYPRSPRKLRRSGRGVCGADIAWAGVPVHNTNRTKKLRYMSKFAAIFATSDNTQLSCTQPIANLLTACL